jgi:hypothetical protein
MAELYFPALLRHTKFPFLRFRIMFVYGRILLNNAELESLLNAVPHENQLDVLYPP